MPATHPLDPFNRRLKSAKWDWQRYMPSEWDPVLGLAGPSRINPSRPSSSTASHNDQPQSHHTTLKSKGRSDPSVKGSIGTTVYRGLNSMGLREVQHAQCLAGIGLLADSTEYSTVGWEDVSNIAQTRGARIIDTSELESLNVLFSNPLLRTDLPISADNPIQSLSAAASLLETDSTSPGPSRSAPSTTKPINQDDALASSVRTAKDKGKGRAIDHHPLLGIAGDDTPLQQTLQDLNSVKFFLILSPDSEHSRIPRPSKLLADALHLDYHLSTPVIHSKHLLKNARANLPFTPSGDNASRPMKPGKPDRAEGKQPKQAPRPTLGDFQRASPLWQEYQKYHWILYRMRSFPWEEPSGTRSRFYKEHPIKEFGFNLRGFCDRRKIAFELAHDGYASRGHEDRVIVPDDDLVRVASSDEEEGDVGQNDEQEHESEPEHESEEGTAIVKGGKGQKGGGPSASTRPIDGGGRLRDTREDGADGEGGVSVGQDLDQNSSNTGTITGRSTTKRNINTRSLSGVSRSTKREPQKSDHSQAASKPKTKTTAAKIPASRRITSTSQYDNHPTTFPPSNISNPSSARAAVHGIKRKPSTNLGASVGTSGSGQTPSVLPSTAKRGRGTGSLRYTTPSRSSSTIRPQKRSQFPPTPGTSSSDPRDIQMHEDWEDDTPYRPVPLVTTPAPTEVDEPLEEQSALDFGLSSHDSPSRVYPRASETPLVSLGDLESEDGVDGMDGDPLGAGQTYDIDNEDIPIDYTLDGNEGDSSTSKRHSSLELDDESTRTSQASSVDVKRSLFQAFQSLPEGWTLCASERPAFSSPINMHHAIPPSLSATASTGSGCDARMTWIDLVSDTMNPSQTALDLVGDIIDAYLEKIIQPSTSLTAGTPMVFLKHLSKEFNRCSSGIDSEASFADFLEAQPEEQYRELMSQEEPGILVLRKRGQSDEVGSDWVVCVMDFQQDFLALLAMSGDRSMKSKLRDHYGKLFKYLQRFLWDSDRIYTELEIYTPPLPPLWSAILSAYAITHYCSFGIDLSSSKALSARFGLVDPPYTERVQHWERCTPTMRCDSCQDEWARLEAFVNWAWTSLISALSGSLSSV